MSATREQIEAELDRIQARRDDLEVEVTAKGQVDFRWSTGTKLMSADEALTQLRSLPDGAGFQAVWSALFDFPDYDY